MKIIDISWPIALDMTQYKNKNTLRFEPIIKPESSVRETLVTMDTHCGTHIDAPLHFLPDGISINELPLSSYIGSCRVIDCTRVTEAICRDDLIPHALQQGEIILLKTRNSLLKPDALFNASFIYLSQDAASYLAEKGIKAIGIDYLGIERNQAGHPTHKALLAQNIPIIEGLRLALAEQGSYFLVCLPLAFQGLDAAPARAILLPSNLP